jgi:monoamine oxidase
MREDLPPEDSCNHYDRLLPAPVGHIYWAGSEIAECWGGFFEGALLTGEAAAKAILGKVEENP